MLQQCLGEDAQGPIKKDDFEEGGKNDSLLPTKSVSYICNSENTS